MNDEGRDPIMEPVINPDEYRRRLGERDGSTPQQRAMAASPPETAALTHGVYLQDGNCMSCDKCAVRDVCEHYLTGERCAIERDLNKRRRTEICQVLTEDGQDPIIHDGLVDSAVLAQVRLGRATRFVALRGEFRSGPGGDDYTGVAKQIPALQGALVKALDALNLTPAARAKLDAQRQSEAGGLAGVVLQVHARREALNEGAVDAEFEPAEPAAASGELRAASNGDGDGNGNGDDGGDEA